MSSLVRGGRIEKEIEKDIEEEKIWTTHTLWCSGLTLSDHAFSNYSWQWSVGPYEVPVIES